MRALTIGELEAASGVPRQTTYYYVRNGLLPGGQKASASRTLYTDDQVDLLKRIEELRGQGLRRAEIRSRLDRRIRAAENQDVDLVARREEETRQAILAAATRSFATRGYKGTRMADLVTGLGVTPQVLYANFPTKRNLFVACYKVAVQYMNAELLPRFAGARDAAELQVWYMYADSGIKAFAPNLMLLATEAAQHDPEARRDLLEAYETIVRDAVRDLRSLRSSETEPPFDDELIIHGAMGAYEQMVARASLDDQFTFRDCVWHSLGLFLGLMAMYSGDLDIGARLEPYRELIDRVASCPPPVPEELRP